MTKKRTTAEKATIIKIAEKVGELAGKIVNKKEQLVALAGNAFSSVKASVNDIAGKKKPTARKSKKAAAKKLVRPAAKKAGRAAKKKVETVKKVVKKSVKKATKATGKKA